MSAVPLDASDLAGWAVRIYDENLRHPDLVRLVAWLRLERRPDGRLSNGANDEPKLTAIAKAQANGQVRPGDPFDLMSRAEVAYLRGREVYRSDYASRSGVFANP